MQMATELLQWSGFDYLFNPHKRLFWGYLLLSFFIAIVYLRCTRLSFTSVFSLNIWWHPSARLDYAYFILSSIIKLTMIVPLVLSVREVALWVLKLMDQVFGYQEKLSVDPFWLIIGYTLSLFIVSDFSRYVLHRLMHHLPFLWEFHKVHHSAQVLTPVTFYRVHPVENILFGFRYAISAGSVTGVFVYYFGAGLEIIDILGINLFVFLAHMAGDNLRHSPIKVRYPDWLEKVLISPAQHQYHHTIQGNRTNYGGVLSVWDRMFGSLKFSRPTDRHVYGIDDVDQFTSLSSLLFLPFRNIFTQISFRFIDEKVK